MMNALRRLPSVDRLIGLLDGTVDLPHQVVVTHARALLDELRQTPDNIPAPEQIAHQLATRLASLTTPTLRPIINATGVLLQTNLGRAHLSTAAQHALQQYAGAASIEYDLIEGQRGERNHHIAKLLTQLTGAEGAVAVNNNAAAILLILSAFAVGKEVIVSRGQAVEIGGGYRIPDVLRQSGATLVEVGTTNRTYARDYEAAITERTAMILRVHTSNFRIQGFVHDAKLDELARIARAHNILLVDDVGSGSLIDVAQFGLTTEPLVQERIAHGADLVCFSGDKLLGGPQAGLIVGRAPLIQQLTKHPLMRAIRLDKLIMAALQATLMSYIMGRALTEIPIWQMISVSLDSLTHRAQRILSQLPVGWQVRPCESTIGGGSLPGDTLPSVALVRPHDTPQQLAYRLRTSTPAIVGRVANQALWLDVRSVLPQYDDSIIERICQVQE
ncbi:MAG: L-seryl-tRNA(Sec) selenium transferase [Chloroflexota bacterium]|jgi:L-seryl-tRNA(Ser) seleniumtransferase